MRFPRSQGQRHGILERWMTPGAGSGRSALVTPPATPPPPLPSKTDPTIAGSRFATIVVAAANSTDAGKFAADPYVGDGTSGGDGSVVQAALTDLDDVDKVPQRAGDLLLLEGDYDLTTVTLENPSDVWIHGVGPWGTYLHASDAQALFSIQDGAFAISDLQIAQGGPVFEFDIVSLGISLERLYFDGCNQLMHGLYSSGTSIIWWLRMRDIITQSCGTSGGWVVDLQRRLFYADLDNVINLGNASGAKAFRSVSNDGNDSNYVKMRGCSWDGDVTIEDMYGLTIADGFVEGAGDLTLANIDTYTVAGMIVEGTFDDTGCTNGSKAANVGTGF